MAAIAAISISSVAFALNFHPAFGGSFGPKHGERMSRSDSWNGSKFVNPQPIWQDTFGGLSRQLGSVADASPATGYRPSASAPIGQSSDLAITWLGHSSLIIEARAVRILIDPVWSDRVSPFSWIGPRRYFPVGKELRPTDVDLVLISHDHYDHLDRGTIERLAQGNAVFVVPLGVGTHLGRWGIPGGRIRELDWWESFRTDRIRITATPARHGAGRVSPFANKTLWAGFAIEVAGRKIWYSGDTGYHDDIAEIGRRLGPFDVTMIEAGQYDRTWPDWHLGPEQAVAAHEAVGGERLLPVHWGGFTLAHHGWTEPAERILAAARCRQVRLLLPMPGERIGLGDAGKSGRWWPKAVWRDASTDPIRSTLDGDDAKRYSSLPCGKGVRPRSAES